MTTAVLLRVEGVSKAFGRLQALNRCSLTVEAGTITGLIGPNGAGKTTLFDVVSGFTRPDAGRVVFHDRDVTLVPPFQRIRQGLGRTFQLPRVFGKLTVAEHLRLAGGEGGGWIDDLLDRAALRPFLEEYAGNLSFGQQKLVSILQALAPRPRLVLLDEPAAGINPTLKATVLELVRHINRAGVTFLIIEHDMRVIMEHCQPIIALNFGTPMAVGTAEEIQGNQELIDAYFGRRG